LTTPIGSATSTSSTATAKTSDGASAMGPDAFMKLLVAQLKYQNPMAPADGQAYMTQMATFTQVEKLDQLVKAQTDAAQWQQRVSAEGLVGRQVSGTVDGLITKGSVEGVRYTKDGPVLELVGGATLAAGLVEHVTSSAPSSTASPAGTPSP
jgi:flagellar basal-body rod modification protein FlgD